MEGKDLHLGMDPLLARAGADVDGGEVIEASTRPSTSTRSGVPPVLVEDDGEHAYFPQQ